MATAVPALQRCARLSAAAMGPNQSDGAGAALAALMRHLADESRNVSEVEAVEQWCCRGSSEDALRQCSSEAMAAVKERVSQRARPLMSAVAERKLAVVCESRVPGMAPAERVGAPVLVQWWRLGAGDPWAFPPAASCSAPAAPCEADAYSFVCLKESLALVGAHLDAMREAAAIGDNDVVASTRLNGIMHVNINVSRDGPVAIFATLELQRLGVTLAFAQRGGIAAVERVLQMSRYEDDMRRLTAFLEGAEAQEREGADGHASHESPGAALSRRQAYWRLALSYSIFFNTVAAYVAAVRGRFEACAVALLGDGTGAEVGLWGASRFPNLRFRVTDADGREKRGDAATGQGATEPCVHTVVGALFPCSGTHISATSSDFFVMEFAPLVTHVIAPAPTFSALVVLSAIATLPLDTALTQLQRSTELFELLEGSAELTDLLAALRLGQLRVAGRCCTDAVRGILSREPHLSPAVIARLESSVARALCYHYVCARTTVHFADAAAELGHQSPDSVAALVVSLISDGYVSARIDAVNGTVCTDAPRNTGSAAATVMTETAARAALGFAAVSLRLAGLSAERNLMAVPEIG